MLGRQTCEEIRLTRLDKYADLLNGYTLFPGKYRIVVDQSVPPVVCASRQIPLGLKYHLSEELKKMEQLGVIRKVTHPTQWVHSLVLVAKKDSGIGVRLDPRALNFVMQRAHYQLLTLAELASRLHSAACFSLLNANPGFWVVQLDDESSDLCTFAEPFGRYQLIALQKSFMAKCVNYWRASTVLIIL